MTALTITGAGGYIGSAVAAAAIDAGGEGVRCVVRRPAPDLPGEVVQVRDLRAEAESALAGSGAVVHLAAPNEVRTAADPDGAVVDTIETARAVARACGTRGVKRLVYVSSVHVYGDALTAGTVIDEETPPHPRDRYAAARLSSEDEIRRWSGDSEVVVLRLTNAVGPPARPSVNRWTLVANDLCRQAARGGDLRLRSSGLQWRDFIPMSDVTRTILAAAQGQISAGTFNLGSGTPMTILQLTERVARAATRLGLGRPDVIPGPGGPAEATEPFYVSIERLAAEGFGPRGSLERELEDTIDFCRRQLRPGDGPDLG